MEEKRGSSTFRGPNLEGAQVWDSDFLDIFWGRYRRYFFFGGGGQVNIEEPENFPQAGK